MLSHTHTKAVFIQIYMQTQTHMHTHTYTRKRVKAGVHGQIFVTIVGICLKRVACCRGEILFSVEAVSYTHLTLPTMAVV